MIIIDIGHEVTENTNHQFFSVAQSCLTLSNPWISSCQGSLSITNSRGVLKFMSIESVMPSNHLILYHLLLLLPSIFPSIGVFSNESVINIRCQKYWIFGFSISLSHEYSGLILGLTGLISLLSKGLSSVFSKHSSKASVLQCSAFFLVQVSHSSITTGKTIPLTRQTFVGKLMSLLFNMLSRWVTAFVPRNKRLLISGLQSTSAVILEPKKISLSLFHHFPISLP